MFTKGNNPITDSFWTDQNFADLAIADTYHALYVIAADVLSRMPDGLTQVCGAISTGGLGNVTDNLAVFNPTIKRLQAEGRNVFDQMYFEGPMQRIKQLLPKETELNLLDDFYLPIFKSGKITHCYFMKNWDTSYGARWEHQIAEELGIGIEYEAE